MTPLSRFALPLACLAAALVLAAYWAGRVDHAHTTHVTICRPDTVTLTLRAAR